MRVVTPGESIPRPRHGRMLADPPLLLCDALLVVLAYAAALAMRFDGQVPADYLQRLPAFTAVAVVVYLVLHARLGLYGPLWLQAGPAEACRLLLASTLATATLTALTLVTWPERLLPLSVPLNAGVLALLLLGGTRFSDRLLSSRRHATSRHPEAVRVVLVGRVAQARAVIAQMSADSAELLTPAAVVTDEAVTWGRTLSYVPVRGPVSTLLEVIREVDAKQVLLLPGARDGDAALAAETARAAGLSLKVMPGMHETPGRRPRLRDIRDAAIEDLLGREPIEIDELAVQRSISGRRVLITGAGGSIGSEIARQVSLLGPADLVLLDHDETHLHDAMARLQGPGRSVLGDLREEAFVMQLFARSKPEVVFHAAAHKHVPILEDFPSEAVRTNVHGTEVVVRAAAQHGTQTFVGISTDKAVRPRSVMGASKRLAEQVVMQRSDGMRSCAVRFGNVLGSRGSVVPTFLRQAQAGGPVTVTHPDMTRFFMTTREAVQLVLQASAHCEGGEIFMLDMGEPVRILELAERIIALTAPGPDADVRIEFTGLRPGEKLTEQLAASDEVVEPTSHPKIHRVLSPLVPASVLFPALHELKRHAEARSEERTRELLFAVAGEAPREISLDAVQRSRPAAGHLRPVHVSPDALAR